MSQNNSHEALTHPDLKRKHPECGSKSKEYPVPLSAIPVPPPPLSTKPAATVDPEKPPVKQRLPAKKICLSLPSQVCVCLSPPDDTCAARFRFRQERES
uniref:PEST proteolytic signal-containing nuclear protein n=1 Tax=Mesocestoides corti TaxID=53468 RepID=A0A5K3F5B0_MESCO